MLMVLRKLIGWCNEDQKVIWQMDMLMSMLHQYCHADGSWDLSEWLKYSYGPYARHITSWALLSNHKLQTLVTVKKLTCCCISRTHKSILAFICRSVLTRTMSLPNNNALWMVSDICPLMSESRRKQNTRSFILDWFWIELSVLSSIPKQWYFSDSPCCFQPTQCSSTSPWAAMWCLQQKQKTASNRCILGQALH